MAKPFFDWNQPFTTSAPGDMKASGLLPSLTDPASGARRSARVDPREATQAMTSAASAAASAVNASATTYTKQELLESLKRLGVELDKHAKATSRVPLAFTADALTLTTNGKEALRIDSNGHVGLGAMQNKSTPVPAPDRDTPQTDIDAW